MQRFCSAILLLVLWPLAMGCGRRPALPDLLVLTLQSTGSTTPDCDQPPDPSLVGSPCLVVELSQGDIPEALGQLMAGPEVPGTRTGETMATTLARAGFRTGAFLGTWEASVASGASHGFAHVDRRGPPPGLGATLPGAFRSEAALRSSLLDWLGQAEKGRTFTWVHSLASLGVDPAGSEGAAAAVLGAYAEAGVLGQTAVVVVSLGAEPPPGGPTGVPQSCVWFGGARSRGELPGSLPPGDFVRAVLSIVLPDSTQIDPAGDPILEPGVVVRPAVTGVRPVGPGSAPAPCPHPVHPGSEVPSEPGLWEAWQAALLAYGSLAEVVSAVEPPGCGGQRAARVRFRQAIALEGLAQLPEALAAVRGARRADEALVGPRRHEWNLMLGLGEVEAVRAQAAAAAKVDPTDGEARVMDAVLSSDRSNPRSALAVLEQLVNELPDNPDVLAALADANAHAGEIGKAVALFQRALAVHPGHVLASLGLGRLYLAGDQAASARRVLDDTASPWPEPALLVATGEARARVHDAAGALLLLQQAASVAPANSTTWATAGAVQLQEGDAEAAAVALDRALRLGNREATTWANHARALEQIGRIDDARVAWDRALAAGTDAALLGPRP